MIFVPPIALKSQKIPLKFPQPSPDPFKIRFKIALKASSLVDNPQLPLPTRGETSIWISAKNGCLDMVKELATTHGADINAADNSGSGLGKGQRGGEERARGAQLDMRIGPDQMWSNAYLEPLQLCRCKQI